jgi:hypothetical protein
MMKTVHTNTPQYMYANASTLVPGPKSRVLDSREEPLAQETESLTQEAKSLTQISEEPGAQVSESRTQVVEPMA